jgi:uncharacterized protein YqgC (DUF456 family)
VEVVQQIAVVLGFVLVGLLCLVGIVMSCFTLSGTWVVVVATALAAILRGPDFPGWRTIIIFVLIAAAVEALEAMAGALGVRRRGGSWLAGFSAIGGGILTGLLIGYFLPIIGHVLGTLLGGFAFAFAVEYYRLKKTRSAAQIAVGAVFACLFAMMLKVTASAGMVVFLVIGLSRGQS